MSDLRWADELRRQHRRDRIRRFVGRVTFRSALDATIVALLIGVIALFSILGWLMAQEPR